MHAEDPSADERLTRPTRPRLDLIAIVAIPGALTAFLSFRSGGFFPGTAGLVAAQLALLLAWRVAVARRPFEGVSAGLCLAAAALGVFGIWTLVSSGWSNTEWRATREFSLVVLYLLVLVLFGTLARTPQGLRWLVYGLAAAAAGVCIAALTARLFPDLGLSEAPVHPERLSYPLTYWNSLGLLAGLGVILCGHLACSEREPAIARILGAAALPLLVATLYYTFSRGATWTTLVAAVIYLVVGRPRAVIGAGVAVLPAVVIAFATVNPASVLTDDPSSQAAIDAGRHIALTLVGCALGAGVLRALLLPLDRRLLAISLSIRSRRIAMAATAAACLVFAVLVAGGVTRLVSDKVDEFNSETQVAAAGSARLLQFSGNGRTEHWQVAFDSYGRDHLKGHGAGTYALDWDRDRHGTLDVENAHSLYLEVLGELGLVGLLALAASLVTILVAFAARARGPDRALYAALLAAATAWMIHAGVDWDWEMPAVTLWLFAVGGAALAHAPRPPRPSHRFAAALRVVGVAACLALAIVPVRVALSDARLDDATAALREGDCATATAEANASHDVLDNRAEPFQVIAYCERALGRPDAALAAMKAGLRRDPDNWEMQYGVAVMRAAAGVDPRPAARRAVRLNPRGAIALAGAKLLSGADRRRWRVQGNAAPLTLPD